tara:strand:+ start:41 stop:253 length:213 start_codon:yes stop_codon:yes gene_type:complete
MGGSGYGALIFKYLIRLKKYLKKKFEKIEGDSERQQAKINKIYSRIGKMEKTMTQIRSIVQTLQHTVEEK